MKRISPHLPSPVCNIVNHKKWLRLKLIAAAAAFGLLAGVSGAAIMIGWIWTGYGGGDVWIVSQGRPAMPRAQLEEKIKREISERIIYVYNGLAGAGGVGYFDAQAKVGEAIMISSDGWAALSLPEWNGNYRGWRALSADGAVYEISKGLRDRHAGVAYLKVSPLKAGDSPGSQFKVVSFADDIRPGDEVFVFRQGSWQDNAIGPKIYSPRQAVHLDTAPSALYALRDAAPAGSIVINNQGRIVGLAGKDGLLLPAVYLTNIMPGVLSAQKIIYRSLGVDGWSSEEQPLVVNHERISGFIVQRAWGQGTLLRRGDIILEINGQIAAADKLWYNMKNETARLKVWRNGKALEMESKVLETN